MVRWTIGEVVFCGLAVDPCENNCRHFLKRNVMSDFNDIDYDQRADEVYQEYLHQQDIDKLKDMYTKLEAKYDDLRMQDMPRAITNLTDICTDFREQNDRLEKALANEIRALDDLFQMYTKQSTTLRWLVDHSVAAGSISKAKGAELLGIPLIDYVNENFSETE